MCHEFFVTDAKLCVTEKWCFVSKIVQTYCEKKNSGDRENLLKFEAGGQEFAKKISITRTIYLNSERSEQFW